MSRPLLQVAFVPLLPVTNAATRAFCERPRPHLARRGIASKVFPPSGPGAYLALYRRRQAFRRLRAGLYWYGIVAPRRALQLPRIVRHDVVFIQRALFRYSSPPVLEALVALATRALGRQVVLHCDDALYDVVRPAYYRTRFRLADWVVTGSDEVAAYARRCNANVALIESGIEVGRYPIRRHEARESVVLGWAGHAPNEHLRTIIPALARVCRQRRVIVKVVGDELFSAPELESSLEFEYWRPEREFTLFGEFDIGLMPLVDTPTNRGKEGFKLKEYMAAGLPVICSPVGHNTHIVEHGATGFFALTEEDWAASLLRLIDDPELRGQLGAAGRKVVSERYDAAAYADRLGDFLLSIVGVETPTNAGAAVGAEAP